MPFETFDDVVDALQTLHQQGYILTHRHGNTGVGKTLEDQLGITENNDEEPDIQLPSGRGIELKSQRFDATADLTLFSKEPPKHTRRLWKRRLIDKFGYRDDEKDRHALYSTLTFEEPNNQGLYLTFRDDTLVIEHEDWGRCASYPTSALRSKFGTKLPELILVLVDTRDTPNGELFWYKDIYHLTGFDADAFFDLIRSGDIIADTRMHWDKDEGKSGYRTHGTAFRVRTDDVTVLFDEQTDLLSASVATSDVDVDVQRYGQQFLSQYV